MSERHDANRTSLDDELGMLAHDLRNSLYAARGLLELLTHPRSDPLSDQQREDLVAIDGVLDEALALVDRRTEELRGRLSEKAAGA